MHLGLVLFVFSGYSFAQSDVEINRRPFTDLSLYVIARLESKSVDLTAPFSIELSGTLSKEGKIDPKTARYTKVEGDKSIVEIAQKVIEAFNDSGFFVYFAQLSAKNVTIRLSQNESDFTASFISEVESEKRARSIASSLSLLISTATQTKRQGDRNDTDDLVFLQSTRSSSEGKNFVVMLNLSKSILHNLISRKLSESKSIAK